MGGVDMRPEMASWLKPLADALGVATPFIYAAATYGLFSWLDKKASGQAKRAITSWFKPVQIDRERVSATVVEIFDRFYTTPLLGWRAFLRSSIFSLVLSAVFVYEY